MNCSIVCGTIFKNNACSRSCHIQSKIKLESMATFSPVTFRITVSPTMVEVNVQGFPFRDMTEGLLAAPIIVTLDKGGRWLFEA